MTNGLTECSICCTMSKRQPITDVLRDALNDSELSFLALGKATGVLRQSLMPFARGESGINADAADKLAVFFGLELRPIKRKPEAKAKPTSKRKGA